jgi:signal transduction histidine kinase
MVGDERYVFCTLVDASHEKRRRVLERVFFHDLLSELCVLELLGDSLTQAPPEELGDCARQIAACCRRLGGIVGIHRDLVAAEAGKLSIDQTRVETDSFLSDLADQYRPLLTQKCKLVATSDPVVISTDVGLLSRVLGNMIRNAVEASLPGEVIALACREQGAEVEFRVHNAAVMPREVQARVFQRSFSTKGPARGLGTYGMKLITERYLGGRDWFESSESEGTTFFASFPKILPF